MTAARRALARAPATLLLCSAARPAPRCPRAAAAAAAAAAPMSTRATAPLWPAKGGVVRRWYSAGGEGSVPGSRVWTFDEVRRQVEADGGGSNSSSKEDPSREKVVIVDVREPDELRSTGKIPGAVNIPVTSAVQSFHVAAGDFEDMHGFARPPRDATLLFYCKAGVRARSAAALARHAGWDSVGEYTGSWLEWEARGGPVERVSGSSGGRD